ncbi:hypothetical protein AB2N04_17210 [Nitratireductor sp. GISD-1A_MAKvit]|uniref:hypothetical protein n=1 Tax=Nitratireductor sp. GISD-1A_MAKvit TaxID=3234198 RepID=UPI0034674683
MDEKTATAGELDGVISGLHELKLISDYGFYNQLRRNNWRKLETGFWLFKDRQFHMIAGFSGDGRGDTREVYLIVSEVISRRANPDTLQTMLNTARERVRVGRLERWNHEF